jgi:hypothetical protein
MEMKLSSDTKEVLSFLDYVTGDRLRKRKDLGVILEVLAAENKVNLANELLFYGSALWNTLKISKRSSTANLELEKIEIEIPNLFNTLTEILNAIYQLLPQNEQTRFNKVYLQPTRGCQLNIVDLCYDLNELKKVQMALRNKPTT